ncbi:hypothetical protein [Catellatospora vulcania]|nr:hypothetical protein [Catellatospora vulcania]
MVDDTPCPERPDSSIDHRADDVIRRTAAWLSRAARASIDITMAAA